MCNDLDGLCCFLGVVWMGSILVISANIFKVITSVKTVLKVEFFQLYLVHFPPVHFCVVVSLFSTLVTFSICGLVKHKYSL